MVGATNIGCSGSGSAVCWSLARCAITQRRLRAALAPTEGLGGSHRGHDADLSRSPISSALGSDPPRSAAPRYWRSVTRGAAAGVSRATPWPPQTVARPRPAACGWLSSRPRWYAARPSSEPGVPHGGSPRSPARSSPANPPGSGWARRHGVDPGSRSRSVAARRAPCRARGAGDARVLAVLTTADCTRGARKY